MSSPATHVASWRTRLALALASAAVGCAALFAYYRTLARPRPVIELDRIEGPVGASAPQRAAASTQDLPSVLELEHPDHPPSAFVRTPWREQLFASDKPGTEPDPFVHYRYKPHYERVNDWPEHPDGAWTLRTNSLGMREDDEPSPVQPDLRILIAGDSHTDGVCNNDEGFGNLLEARLRAERPGQVVESLNAARGGYDPYHYLGTLERFLYLQPDVFVVAIYGGNDFESLLTLYHDYNGTSRPPGMELYGAAIEALLEGDEGAHDAALAQAFVSLKYFDVHPQQMEVALQAARDVVTEILVTSLRNSVHPVFVYVPPATDVEWELDAEHFDELVQALDISPDGLRSTDRMAESLIDFLRGLRVDVVDLREPFRANAEPDYWRTDLHVNLSGQRVIAEALHPLVVAAHPPQLRAARRAPGSTLPLDPTYLASPGSGFEAVPPAERVAPYERVPFTEEAVAGALAARHAPEPAVRFDPVAGYVPRTPAAGSAESAGLAGARSDARRVLVIGDEQVAGGGAARPSLASLLETALRAELSDAAVEVVDGGAAGYTFQNYLGALDNLLALEPDACVLVVSSGNDLFEALRLESLLDQRPFPRRLERYAEELRRAAAAQPAAVEQGLASARYFEEHRPQGKRAFELAVQITAELRRVCDQHGIHLTVAHVPPASALEWGDHAAVLAEAAELLGVGERYLDANQRLVAPYLDQLAQADHDLLELEELAVDGPVFGRDLLLSPAGLTALAEALARRLAAPLAQSR